jgi:hypothetical protein
MTKEVKAPEEVVEAEFTEVQEERQVKCEVSVGVTETGDVYFNVSGSDQSLINIEGLLAYANRHLDKIWEGRLDAARQSE